MGRSVKAWAVVNSDGLPVYGTIYGERDATKSWADAMGEHGAVRRVTVTVDDEEEGEKA